LRFLLQFNQALLYILLIAGIIKALLGSWTNAAVIWAVTLINAIIGFVQESKAEEAIAAVRACQSAGIQVKMITGDHITTAKAIADRMGLESEFAKSDRFYLAS
jgi:magnesium-transporting ATPase (P-type)